MAVEGGPMPPQQPPGAGEPGPLPLYEGAPGQPPPHAQHTVHERNELGTVVNEVIVVTTTTTTRRRYRVEDT